MSEQNELTRSIRDNYHSMWSCDLRCDDHGSQTEYSVNSRNSCDAMHYNSSLLGVYSTVNSSF